jgi:pyridoxal 5'-phosphate synthase pdxT subunit
VGKAADAMKAPVKTEGAAGRRTTAGRARIGVLALQGDFGVHARILRGIGAEVSEVRTADQLAGLNGLIMPGGESTTLLRLMRLGGIDRALRSFHEEGGAVFGTCAGLILLAAQVTKPEQESLGLIDVSVERNAYGRQVDSFVAEGLIHLPGSNGTPLEMVFIRAPRIVRVGPSVDVLAHLGDEPVLVQSGRILAATFHPEVAGDARVHAYFARLASGAAS